MELGQVVYPTKCPLCGRPTAYAKSVSESKDPKDAALWFFCSCGIAFQKEPPKKKLKDQKYIDAHYKLKEFDLVGHHAARQYSPLIEELTYGRKMLDVGFAVPNNMDYLKERGWITFGIENNVDTVETDRIFKDDYETTEKLYQKTYDLVWMGFVLQQFRNPIGALQRAYDILQDDGVLLITTPDIDFLYNKTGESFPHWKKGENYIMWSERALCRELEKIGFNIIMKRRNYYQRFGYVYDVHIIAQKIFY